MAGRRSADCNAGLLVLNHISPKSESDLPGMVQEAYDGSNHSSSVLASFDFMEVVIPWMGFGTTKEKESERSGDGDEIGTGCHLENASEDSGIPSSLLSWAKKLL